MEIYLIIKKNLEKFIKSKYKIFDKKDPIYKDGHILFGNRSFKFDKIVNEAYFNRISLSSSGFYSTPKIKFSSVLANNGAKVTLFGK